MTKSPIYKEMRDWCAENMELQSPELWELKYSDPDQNITYLMRVMGHDFGAWIILVGSCSSVAGDRDNFSGVNLGDVKSISQLNDLKTWLNTAFPETGSVNPPNAEVCAAPCNPNSTENL